MTLVLHRAERADVLAEVLAAELAVPPADPFTREVVAVHSRGVERWLAHRLSAHLGTSPGRADGVCANLEFPFPGRLVQSALATVTGVDPDTDPWRPERLAWPLLDVVDACLDEDWLFVLAGHLGAGAGAEDDLARRDRRFAAVRHLADLYDRYAVHRPAMVRAWHQGRDEDGDGQALDPHVAWQAELWRRLRAAVDQPSPAERTAAGCAALAADRDLAGDLPERLFLFGLTRLPASYLDVLEALAAHRDVHVLALHPSPASWGTGDQVALRHPLLRAWGRDSHEMGVVLRRRLAVAPHATTEDRHHPLPDDDPARPTLLRRLQAAIRADEPPPTDPDDRARLDPGDRSVQVHACHGRARQAEVLRDAITHLLADDPTLEPRDVVVMCPDIDDLAPLLRAAFDDEPDHPRAIPHRLADRSLRQTNPVLGAVAELLALVDARLTATQVLAFAALPPVRQRFGFDEDDLERLARWVDQTGTRWGLDGDHRAPYDLAAVDTGTWAAGLRRVLLGVAMSEDELRLVGGVLPLDDVDSGDIDLAGRFAELVGRLGGAVRSLRDPRPVAAWVHALDAAADQLLDTRWEDAWQRSQLDQLLAEVVQEAGGDDGDGSRATPLRLAELRDLLADRLKGRPSRAAFRTGEMTMCTLVPMRSVPHRVVCLVGLDDGAFPRGGAPDGDDLLVAARHPGDHDRRAEDRQLLLDAVLAAGDHLVVTYDGHDPRTNEPLPPAVPVNELLDVLDDTAVTADGRLARHQVVRHHPLQPADRRSFEPGALGTDGPWSFDDRLLAGAEAAARPPAPPAPFLDPHVPLPPVVDEGVIELAALVAAVDHPARAFLRQRLGLGLFDDDDRHADALALELDGLSRWQVGRRLLDALLAGADPDVVVAAERARGQLPPGLLGERVLADARQKAERLADSAREVADGRPGSIEVDVALPDGRHLVGTVADVFAGAATIRPVTFSSMSAKRQLATWVRHLAASAATDGGLTSVLVARWGGRSRRFGLPPITAEQAVGHLAALVALRDEVLCGPVPLASKTSHAWLTRQREGDEDPGAAAAREWDGDFHRPGEGHDAEHVLLYGGVRPFDDVITDPRFAVLAREVWTPALDAHRRWAAS
ncbi:MAG: exodeoxyribonuclease V subunit gamma [Microthrixaceae bacterium]|nr:exodeoxyribonuclease V subunit gamma [Microthrixaceae bacterium]